MNFEKNTFGKRLGSMLSVDFRRMFTMPLVYIMIGVCFVIPVLILVMTTMMDGSVSVNPQTGEETVMEGFDNVWQIIGTVSGSNTNTGMDMGLTTMCNINLLYFIIAIFINIFVSEDFRSGYAKNLFTVRAKKTDYIISKTLVCFVAGALMVIVFFIGSLLGGAISGLPFEMSGFGISNIIMCMLSKILLVAAFSAVYLLASVIGKSKLWLSIICSLCVSMLFFMMIPALTPLNSTVMNVVIALIGAVLFSIGLGAISNNILKKTSLI